MFLLSKKVLNKGLKEWRHECNEQNPYRSAALAQIEAESSAVFAAVESAQGTTENQVAEFENSDNLLNQEKCFKFSKSST